MTGKTDEKSEGFTRRGSLYISLAAFFWSFSGACVKYIQWSAFSVSCVRSAIGCVLFFAYRRKLKLDLTWRNLLSGFFMLLTGTTFMLANKYTTAANAIVLHYTAPLFIVLYNAVIERRRPTKLDTAMLVTVLGGCVLAFADGLGNGNPAGDLLALLSGLTFAGLMILDRAPGTDSIQTKLIGNIMTAVLLFPFLFFDKNLSFDLKTTAIMLFMGLVQYGMGHLMYAIGIKKTKALSASLIAMAEPILNPIWVFLIIGEIPGPLSIIGFVTVISSVIAYNILLSRKVSRTQT